MKVNEEVKNAIDTLKTMCSDNYRTDEYWDMECLDCPFYRVSDGGYSYCY